MPNRNVVVHIKTENNEPVLSTGTSDDCVTVDVGDTLVVQADDSLNYSLWIQRRGTGMAPKEGFPIQGGAQDGENKDRRRIDVNGDKQVECLVINTVGQSENVTFNLGVNWRGQLNPRGHNGGSGSAGTLNVHPT